MTIRHDVVTHAFTTTFINNKAAQLCRRSDVPRADHEDLQQEMLLYLSKKAHLFDPARGNIEAFVTMAIKSWVGMEFRRRHRLKRRAELYALSIERTPIEQDGDATTLSAVLQDADLHRRRQLKASDPKEQLELAEAVAHAISTLTLHENQLLVHVAEHGVASATRKHDISRRQIKNALTRMRTHFEDAGLGVD